VANILDDLSLDHRNLARLFDLVGRELVTFGKGGLPDYELVASVLDYCLNYPDLYHHPKEDLIYERLKSRAPDVAQVIGDLREEHQKLGVLTRRFSTAVRNVVEDETLPRDWFTDVANDYLNFSRNHMQMEEVLFYPAARKHLTAADWDALDAEAENVADPLFGGDTQAKYQNLYREIMEWGGVSEPSVEAS